MSSVFFSGGRKKAVVEDVLRRARCVKEESFVCALCACVCGWVFDAGRESVENGSRMDLGRRKNE
jgi:hypothetical protein